MGLQIIDIATGATRQRATTWSDLALQYQRVQDAVEHMGTDPLGGIAATAFQTYVDDIWGGESGMPETGVAAAMYELSVNIAQTAGVVDMADIPIVSNGGNNHGLLPSSPTVSGTAALRQLLGQPAAGARAPHGSSPQVEYGPSPTSLSALLNGADGK